MQPAGGLGANHIHAETSAKRLLQSLLHSFSALLVLLSLLHTASSNRSRCNDPPPPLSCGAFWQGNAYYYNASSCLSWPDWGCPGNTMFSTLEECTSTCEPATEQTPTLPPTTSPASEVTSSDPPTLSPEEMCSLPIRNYICATAHVTQQWVYNRNLQECHFLAFLNCIEVQPNMFETEEACVNMCGQFSTNYVDTTTPVPPLEMSISPQSASLMPSSSPSLSSTYVNPSPIHTDSPGSTVSTSQPLATQQALPPTDSSSSPPDTVTTISPDPGTTGSPDTVTTISPDPGTTGSPDTVTTISPDPGTTGSPDTVTTISTDPDTTDIGTASSPDPGITGSPDIDTASSPHPGTPDADTASSPDLSTANSPDPSSPSPNSPDSNSPNPSSPDTSTSAESSDSHLTVFDMASIGVGVMIFVLFLVLMIVIISLVCQRRRLTQSCPPSSVIKSVKSSTEGNEDKYYTIHPYLTTPHIV